LHRQRLVTLVLLSLGATILGCNGKGPETTTNGSTPTTTVSSTAISDAPKTPEDPFDKYRVRMKPGHKLKVKNVLASTKLIPCKEDYEEPGPVGAPEPPEELGTGGFVCSTVYRVELLVKTGDPNVHVSPSDPLPVEVGDCILWEAKTDAGDPLPAGVSLINFFDSASDVPPGKTVAANAIPVGRKFCRLRRALCVMQIGLARGTYRYEARVRHGPQEKKSDPEVQVSCTSCDGPGGS
jgi:hypothetical protein